MANQGHLDILKQGVEVWNKWRQECPDTIIDFSGANLAETDLTYAILTNTNFTGANLLNTKINEADLSGADLTKANLRGAQLNESNLSGATLTGAFLEGAFLIGANFSNANLRGANLELTYLLGANFTKADLRKADLRKANLNRANLNGANLKQANLRSAVFVNTSLKEATLTQCSIYGISVWNVELEGTKQENLIITDDGEPIITVDNLKVAQFIYLLLNNEEIRDVIDTITSKVVLILGRFTTERKIVLDAIRDELRKRNYTPVLFDFEKLANRDITETVSTLAHMARFVIADITDAKSISQELQTIVPNLPSVPVQPLILNSQHEYGMFEHFTRYPWVLPIHRYTDELSLLQSLAETVIAPAEQKSKELAQQ